MIIIVYIFTRKQKKTVFITPLVSSLTWYSHKQVGVNIKIYVLLQWKVTHQIIPRVKTDCFRLTKIVMNSEGLGDKMSSKPKVEHNHSSGPSKMMPWCWPLQK